MANYKDPKVTTSNKSSTGSSVGRWIGIAVAVILAILLLMWLFGWMGISEMEAEDAVEPAATEEAITPDE